MAMSVLITGASSGIGKALALHYAAEGAILGLSGRNAERLEAVAAQCRARGAASVSLSLIDVRDRAALTAWIADFDRASPVDILFANAGVSAGTTAEGAFEAIDASYALIETNVLGAFNTVHAALPQMMARGRGQIALIGSLAGFLPLADSPSYCASKSAILAYGLSLREGLRGKGIRVSVVCPGFVETPMAEQVAAQKPFLVKPDDAARRIAQGLARNKAVIAFPFLLAFGARLGGLLPDFIRRLLMPGFRIRDRKPQ